MLPVGTVAATADGLDVGSGFGSNVDSDAQAHCEGSLKPTVFPDKDYHDWWREQVVEQESLGLFTVRLIGDASNPQLFTPMAPTDLAYCSKWGRNRVAEQQATQSPINLVLPVLTRPDVVEQAVAGILSGQIGLTWFSVEPLLVLANAVGFVSLETTCADFLTWQSQDMTAEEYLSLAQLADHLGLSSLLDTAAEMLIQMPWHNNISPISTL